MHIPNYKILLPCYCNRFYFQCFDAIGWGTEGHLAG